MNPRINLLFLLEDKYRFNHNPEKMQDRQSKELRLPETETSNINAINLSSVIDCWELLIDGKESEYHIIKRKGGSSGNFWYEFYKNDVILYSTSFSPPDDEAKKFLIGFCEAENNLPPKT